MYKQDYFKLVSDSLSGKKKLKNKIYRIAFSDSKFLSYLISLEENKYRDFSGKKKKQARILVSDFCNQILDKIKPEYMHDILLLEDNGLVINKLMELASKNTDSATKLALLLQRALYSLSLDNDEQMLYTTIFVNSLTFTGQKDYQCYVSKRRWQPEKSWHDWMMKLLSAANQNNEKANNFFISMFMLTISNGIILIPQTEEVFSQIGHVHNLAMVIQDAQRIADNQPVENRKYDKVFYPLAQEYLDIAKKLYQQADDFLDICAQFNSYLNSFLSYQQQMENEINKMFLNIINNPHCFVRQGKTDKVSIRIPEFRSWGIVSLIFEIEGCVFPEVYVNFLMNLHGEKFNAKLKISKDGKINGYNPEWPEILIYVLAYIIFDSYHELVCNQKSASSSRKKTTIRKQQKAGQQVYEEETEVRPHFRTLPEGWQASAEAEENLKNYLNNPEAELPEGMTFVKGFSYERGTGKFINLSQKDWEEIEKIPPVFTYSRQRLEQLKSST